MNLPEFLDLRVILPIVIKLALWTGLYYYVKLSRLSPKKLWIVLSSKDQATANLIDSFYRFLIKVLPLVYLVGVAFILGANLSPLWAALAALPLAMSLGAKTVAENIWGRLVIYWWKKFKVGDEVRIDGDDFIVDNVGLLTTALYDASTCKEGHTFEIPNGQIVKAKIGMVGRKYHGIEDSER